ncbi:hypothetical protein M441DRAFT_445543 [Trichoderma asperellum CBS 433.97]|uniref:Actin-like ATPase domain-containing protein n=1 Tax=Trichoderma asperellum (strain ATCC 204424 / CBS 433.97 / NBRC 101777) TaxID=1042311 RepID=A0A2T3ZPY7_TRIA4|nr:hypothetical protein M441DRAFT_445543 [Trichoderma asperellum CBS 433.97]PTB46849.1 hypothetical protein M441DRAFT_445543 [Trichoderma asperellum CBS 433.97]
MQRTGRKQRGTARGVQKASAGDPTIVIGIDFGTTFSGVAWARSSRPEQVNIITSWKSRFNFNSDKEKVPTIISHEEKDGAPLWGYVAPQGSASIQWFKLCLLDKEDIPQYQRGSEHLKAAMASLEKSNAHVVDVISDYLRELWQYTMNCIERAEGASIVDVSAFKVVVTLPAIWPAYAQFRMKEAVERAGILNIRGVFDTALEFISEPEAAALAALQDLSDRADMVPGDHFVVCDAGGGTVDVITYTIVSKDPIRVKESVRGDGKLCGATFVDELFRNLLRQKIPSSTWERLGEDGIARLMNNEWENGIKPQFNDDGRKWSIQAPVSSRKRDHEQYISSDISIHNYEIVNVFHPITSQIVELVTAQVNEVKMRYKKQAKFVILVGGFGRCHYLYNCLIEGLRGKVEVLQSSGARPWTAVCRGAAIRGLEQSDGKTESAICSRIARASYGTMCNVIPWSEKDHSIQDREWCSIARVYMAADQASWFLRIGETITVGKSIELGFSQDFESPASEIVTNLIYSNSPQPSERCDDTVKELCQLRWSRIPKFDDLPTWTNNKGRIIRRLSYVIKMTSNGVSLDFEISHDDRIVASKNVAADYSESGTAAHRHAGHLGDDNSGTYVPPGKGPGGWDDEFDDD